MGADSRQLIGESTGAEQVMLEPERFTVTPQLDELRRKQRGSLRGLRLSRGTVTHSVGPTAGGGR